MQPMDIVDTRQLILSKIKTKFQQLCTINRMRRFFDIFPMILFWIVGALLITLNNPLFTLFGILLITISLNICVLLLHEGMHQTLFRSPIKNYLFSVILGIIIGGISFTAYRALHILHHQHLGNTGDPDHYPAYTNNKYLLWLMYYARIITGALIYTLLVPFLGWKAGGHGVRKKIILEYSLIVTLFTIIGLLLPLSIIVWYWFIPLILVAYITAVRGFAEHSFTDLSNPLTSSRTIQGNFIINFFILNINYHLAHHLFPEVPSYNLQKLHRLIIQHHPRQVVTKSYLSFLTSFIKRTGTLNESPIGLIK